MRINEIVNLIYNSINENRNFFWHMDVVIVGENRAGKSNLLKDIIKKLVLIKHTLLMIKTDVYHLFEDFQVISLKNLMHLKW